jgi:hypothetical protein
MNMEMVEVEEEPEGEAPLDALLRLRVVAEADPGAIARVLERFQSLNIFPRRVVADQASTGQIHIQVDVFGISERRLNLIAAKLRQVPSVFNAYWHHM